jgi:magnesium transporter
MAEPYRTSHAAPPLAVSPWATTIEGVSIEDVRGVAGSEGRAPAALLVELLEAGQDEAAVALARSLHPAELANACASVHGELRDLLVEQLAPDEVGAMLGYLEPHYREDFLVGLGPDRIAEILRTVPDDVATDVVQELPDATGAAVMEAVPDLQQAAIDVLMEHGAETAGGRMTGQRVSVSPNLAAGEVIEQLRSLRPDVEQPFYIYVTDAAGRLEGVLNLRSLITSQPGTPVTSIATTDLVTVTADTDQEEAARILKRYKLLSLPVVDNEHRLLGALTADDLIDVLEDEATEDMFRQVGVHEDEDLRSIRRSIRYRLPWLMVNLVTVLGAAFVVSLFEDTVARVAVLAAFLPVVAGQGGNAGIQTLTVVIRSLALGRLEGRNMARVIGHELAVGLVTGLVTGAGVALVAMWWQGNPTLGLVVGAALVANVVVGVVGLQRLRQDPALSAGIWLTTTTDVLGFLVFLSLAALLVEAID